MLINQITDEVEKRLILLVNLIIQGLGLCFQNLMIPKLI